MLRDYTIKQLLVAAALSRHFKPRQIAKMVGVTESYISLLKQDLNFLYIQKLFSLLTYDNDTAKIKNSGTLMMEVGRLLFDVGQKEQTETEQENNE